MMPLFGTKGPWIAEKFVTVAYSLIAVLAVQEWSTVISVSLRLSVHLYVLCLFGSIYQKPHVPTSANFSTFAFGCGSASLCHTLCTQFSEVCHVCAQVAKLTCDTPDGVESGAYSCLVTSANCITKFDVNLTVIVSEEMGE